MGDQSSINEISEILLKSAKKVLEKSTLKKITYSSTIQRIPKVSMKPDLTCFVQFNGDYSGLVVMNFSDKAAVQIYKSYMMSMGLPENELANDFTSAEISDSIGEISNQIMGNLMSKIEEKYELNSLCGQPRALALNSAITLVIDSDYLDNRRLSFKIGHDSFHIEIAMEHTEFVDIKKPNTEEQ